VLAGHGYTNVLGGVHHITGKSVHDMREHGFHVLLNEDNLAEDVPDLHERAARFLAETPRSPWFFSLGFDQTHRDSRHDDPDSGACFSQPSRYDPKALDGRYVMPPPLFPDGQETRGDMASFKEGARRLDERIGHVLDALDRHGYSENTLVIITTDHGIAWPGMKCNLTDHGIGVTLILRGPGGFSGGRVIDSMVTHLDLFPTMLALADLRPCSWLAGKSLLPLASGVVDPLHDTIFAEQGWHDAPEPQRAIRTTRYKYIRRFIPVGPRADNCDPGPTKKIAADAGFFDRELGDELLFDLRLDPQETWNRVTDPKLGAMRTALRHQLDDWMRRTNDPSLAGKPVPPPGLRGGPARSAT
jgi:arylsulfatase A-like enzyme